MSTRLTQQHRETIRICVDLLDIVKIPTDKLYDHSIALIRVHLNRSWQMDQVTEGQIRAFVDELITQKWENTSSAR